MGVRAALLTELNKDLEVRDDFELCDPGPDEVRIRMVASGVCHSDVSFQNGTVGVPLPSILGHEGAGEILQVGDSIENVKPGDSVIISWVPPCGSCYFCDHHESHLCMTGMVMAAVTGPLMGMATMEVLAAIGGVMMGFALRGLWSRGSH